MNYLSIKQIAKKFSVSESTVKYAWRNREDFPRPFKIDGMGRKLFFAEDEIDQWAIDKRERVA